MSFIQHNKRQIIWIDIKKNLNILPHLNSHCLLTHCVSITNAILFLKNPAIFFSKRIPKRQVSIYQSVKS